MTSQASDQRTRFRFLDPTKDQVAEEIDLDNFLVTLPEFTPASGESPLEDGEAPTKLGLRFRKQFAEQNGISEEEVDHGLIRDIEALSADHDANIRSLSRPYRVRNHAGEQTVVRLVVHTPLVGTALINGRMLSRVGRQLHGRARVLTSESGEHPLVRMPLLSLDEPQQALLITDAQRAVEQLRDYGTDDRDFLDSLALEGIITPPVVAPFLLRDGNGSEGFLTQTDDGWRRVQGSRELMSELLGVSADLSYKHWEGPNGELTLRSHNAETIRKTLGLLRFGGSDKSKSLFPPSNNSRSIETWMRSVGDKNRAIRAFHRLRTTEIELVLAVRPLPGKSAFDVFYIDMAGRHVPGLSAKDWDKAGVEGVVAVRAIDALVAEPEIDIDETTRAAWLGEAAVPTADDPARTPHRNRLVAGTHLFAALTTEGDATGRARITRDALIEHGLPNHPDRAATVAAAQAAVVFQVDGTAEVGQVTAALASVFKHASLWKDQYHVGGFWSEHISEDPTAVHDAAVEELSHSFSPPDSAKHVGSFGPYQRAMMALTAVSHITNPKLLADKDSLTRTGRGGRGEVSKSDPAGLLQRMVMDTDGLARCLAIIRSSIAAEPSVPVDPIDGETVMTEHWLRSEYLSKPEPTPEDSDPDPLDPESRWWKDANGVLDDAELLRNTVTEMMDVRKVPAEILGLDADEYDEDLAPLMFEQYGVPSDTAKQIKEALNVVIDFATDGKAFYTIRKGH